MTIEVRITGTQPEAAAPAATDLLQELGNREPERRTPEPDDTVRRDVATAATVATLIVSIPGGIIGPWNSRSDLTAGNTGEI